jgi:hypothetical protein
MKHGGPARHPYAVVDYIPQSRNKNVSGDGSCRRMSEVNVSADGSCRRIRGVNVSADGSAEGWGGG